MDGWMDVLSCLIDGAAAAGALTPHARRGASSQGRSDAEDRLSLLLAPLPVINRRTHCQSTSMGP